MRGVIFFLMALSIAVSAQDVHWEKEGAFTGEVSVGMLVEVGCTYTIIGHSERRQYFGETDETVEKKRATGCLSTFLQRHSKGYECLPSLSSPKGHSSGARARKI